MEKKTKTDKPASNHSVGVNDVFEEFFQDYERRRWSIYRLNFVRGIFFGLGTFIGGTLVIAGMFWFLSLFESVPYISDVIKNIQTSIEDARK
ncbi:MAG TPA: DUF5665 domain-containing protein [Candidatus Saccharimonadales bacterium]|nr:DUF5665 domain-containing protein [Candidatus Saccharimonadales bacterium]